MMRATYLLLPVGVAVSAASSASAATILIIKDPMTLESRTVVLDTRGPDRALLCMAPPAMSGCTEIKVRRER